MNAFRFGNWAEAQGPVPHRPHRPPEHSHFGCQCAHTGAVKSLSRCPRLTISPRISTPRKQEVLFLPHLHLSDRDSRSRPVCFLYFYLPPHHKIDQVPTRTTRRVPKSPTRPDDDPARSLFPFCISSSPCDQQMKIVRYPLTDSLCGLGTPSPWDDKATPFCLFPFESPSSCRSELCHFLRLRF